MYIGSVGGHLRDWVKSAEHRSYRSRRESSEVDPQRIPVNREHCEDYLRLQPSRFEIMPAAMKTPTAATGQNTGTVHANRQRKWLGSWLYMSIRLPSGRQP